MRPCYCGRCGWQWDAEGESPDGCPQCGDWKAVEIDRCYECPLTALDQEMGGETGRLVDRAFRIRNMIDAGVRYSPADLSAQEAAVIRILYLETPKNFD